MTTLIRQRGPSDCGIAALAMFTGRPYEECYAAGLATGEFHPKRGTAHTQYILRHMGYKQDNLRGSEENDACTGRAFRHYYDEYSIRPEWWCRMFWGRPCLLSVPSLNNPGGSHMIYYDGEQVFDPQNGRRGKKFTPLDGFDKLAPTNVIAWRV